METPILRSKFVLTIFFLFCISFVLYSQDRFPYIAVIPFRAINVSEMDAEAISALFETALVSTGVYRVIEQAQMHEILKVQEFAVSDCTSEECAVEIGQLLSAEQIILGTLVSVGGKYVLSAKVVDVAKGVSLKAAKVEHQSLADMTDGAEVLARKLAGLKDQMEESPPLVEGLGEMFVETNPSGADVFVNGVNNGVSPLLIENIPLGYVRVESRKGDLYAIEDVHITSSLLRLSLDLVKQYGSLIIRSQYNALQVFIDGEASGPLGSGLIDHIPIGRHTVELEGDGLYWVHEVEIELGVITQIDATPRACGGIRYSLPPGVKAQIKGDSFEQVVEGTGMLSKVWAGRYSIQIESDIYDPYSALFKVIRGREIEITPKLMYNSEHEYQKFDQLLSEVEWQISAPSRIDHDVLQHLVDLKSDIQSARYEHPELVARSEFLMRKAEEKLLRQETIVKLAALSRRQAAVQQQIDLLQLTRRRRNLGKWFLLGTGVASVGTSATFLFMAADAYEDYQNATITSEVIHYRDQVRTFKTVAYVGLGVGGVGFGGSLVFWFTQRKEKRYQSELADLEERIEGLQVGLK